MTDSSEIVQVPDGHRLAIRALSADRSGGHGRWPQKRRWTEPVAKPRLCVSGWHACLDTQQVVEGGWFGERFWLVELAGDIIVGDDKVAAERARLLRPLPWDDRVARLWACDVAERVLSIFEHERPYDDRPRQAIKTAQAFARGEASAAAMAVARAAAMAAASVTVRVSASTIARTPASTAAMAAVSTSARAPARAPARAAARAAAKAVAEASVMADSYDAAWSAERGWQAHHLAVALGLEGTVLDG